MARKNPVPRREQIICRRLNEFRRSTRLSRVAFAEALGLGASRLANYERGSVPLPYAIAKRLCLAFHLSQEWLAEGKGLLQDYIEISPEIESRIPPRALFSAAYDDLIKRELSKSSTERSGKLPPLIRALKPQLAKAGIEIEPVRVIGAISRDAILAMLLKQLKAALEALPPYLFWALYRHQLAAWAEFESAYLPAGTQNITPKSNKILKQTRLTRFRERLRRVTTPRGKKAQLAAFMGVPMPRISEWLTGRKEPGGETTLRLLEWVQAEEVRQPKAPGSATNPAKAKAR